MPKKEWDKKLNINLNNKNIEREIHCFTDNKIIDIFSTSDFSFINYGNLNKTLVEEDWQCYVFQKKN